MKVLYIAEFSLPTNRAYAIHVFRMLDAFSDHQIKSKLFIPYFEKDNFRKSLKFFDLKNSKFISIKRIFSNRINFNFVNRFLFGFKAAKTIKKENLDSLIITRSLITSVFLSLFKVRHFLEIHQEIKGLSRFFLIQLNFINSKFIIKNIFISKSLANFYRNKTNKYVILHDGVDLKRFKKKKIKCVKRISYVGSFYRGRGIELIFEIARELKEFKFYLYGKRNEKYYNLSSNIYLKPFVQQSKIPEILNKSDLLLLPYSKKVHISSDIKSSDISKFMSPLKLFEYLASGTPILCSNIKVLREVLKNQYNSILINNFENKKEWIKKIKEISKSGKKLKFISQNALITSKKYTWLKRSESFINLYKDY